MTAKMFLLPFLACLLLSGVGGCRRDAGKNTPGDPNAGGNDPGAVPFVAKELPLQPVNPGGPFKAKENPSNPGAGGGTGTKGAQFTPTVVD